MECTIGLLAIRVPGSDFTADAVKIEGDINITLEVLNGKLDKSSSDTLTKLLCVDMLRRYWVVIEDIVWVDKRSSLDVYDCRIGVELEDCISESGKVDICDGRTLDICDGRTLDICDGRTLDMCDGRTLVEICENRKEDICDGRRVAI